MIYVSSSSWCNRPIEKPRIHCDKYVNRKGRRRILVVFHIFVLTWRFFSSHLLICKVLDYPYGMKYLSRATCGLAGSTLKTLCRVTVKPLMLCASTAWYSRINARQRQKLLLASRRIVFRIPRAYRTTPDEALTEVVGIILLDLQLQERNEQSVSNLGLEQFPATVFGYRCSS